MIAEIDLSIYPPVLDEEDIDFLKTDLRIHTYMSQKKRMNYCGCWALSGRMSGLFVCIELPDIAMRLRKSFRFLLKEGMI